MKKPLAILLVFLHILPSIPFAQQAETIAVIEFEGKGISQVEASGLSDELEINLTSVGGYKVVERGKMEEVLKEQGFQQTGCVSEECAVEVGKMLGTKMIVVGSISKVGSTFSINAKIVDVASGEIIKSANYKYQGAIDGLLISGMAEVASQLTGKSVAQPTLANTPQKNYYKDAEGNYKTDAEGNYYTVEQVEAINARAEAAIAIGEAYLESRKTPVLDILLVGGLMAFLVYIRLTE